MWENKFGLVVTHVYLHLQADFFEPQAMHVDEGDATDKNMHGANHNLYTLVRQVPPGRQHFFFTWRSDTTMLKIQERDKVGSRRNRALFIGAHCFYLLLSNVVEL